MNRKQFLVVGCQRSGTTILSDLLSQHDEVLLSVNGKLLYYLLIWIYNNPRNHIGYNMRMDEIAFALGRMPIRGLSDKELRQFRDAVACLRPGLNDQSVNPETIVSRIWDTVYSDIAGDRWYGEKYNENLLYLDQINRCLPACKFIFIVRNGFSVATSLITRFSHKVWAPSDPPSALKKWTIWNQHWIQMRDQLKDRYIELRYEDFVKNPVRTYGMLCEFLEINENGWDVSNWTNIVKPRHDELTLSFVPDAEDKQMLAHFGY